MSKTKTGEINVRGDDGLLYLNESWVDDDTGEVSTTSTLILEDIPPDQQGDQSGDQ